MSRLPYIASNLLRYLIVFVTLTFHSSLCTGQAAPLVAAPTQDPAMALSTAPPDETAAAKARRICLTTAVAFAQDHDQTKAWNGFVAATQADSSYAPAWFDLGVMSESEHKWKEARDYFYHYLGVAPKGPDALRAHEQAELLSKYISGEMTPEDMKHADYDAAIERARSLMSAGFYREAIADAGEAQAMDNSRWEAYAVVSLCMIRQHKLTEAGKMRDRALALAPADKRDQVLIALSPKIESEAQK